ncbi:hypothetical protein D1872_282080 [compost metagenome]
MDLSRWNQGSHDSIADTFLKHYEKHGREVGATSFTQYFNKANEFSRNLKGRGVPVDGYTEGAMKYYNKGRDWERYIIVDPDGKIISFGAR